MLVICTTTINKSDVYDVHMVEVDAAGEAM